MTKKKLYKLCWLLLAALVFALLPLAGCNQPPDDGEEPEAPDDPGRTTKIVVAVNTSVMNERNLMVKFKNAFYKVNADIAVEIQAFDDYKVAVNRYVASGKWPDILWMAGDTHSVFSESGYFENLRPYYDEDPDIDADDYYSSIIKSAAKNPSDDGIYFAPRDYNKPTVILNKDMFNAAGVDIPAPAAWNETAFMAACAQLRAAMDNNIDKHNGIKKDSYPVDMNLGWSPVVQSVVRSFGGNLYDIAAPGVTVNSQANIGAYKHIGELIQKGYTVNPNMVSGGQFVGWSAAMAVIVRPDLAANIAEVQNYDFRPWPFSRAGVGCSGYAMASASANKDAAWAFLKYIISEAGQEIFGATGAGVPVLKSLAETGTWVSYGGQGLNHAAFLGATENDFTLNDSDAFPYNKRADIKQYAEAVVTLLGKETTWAGSPLSGNPLSGVWASGSALDSGNWQKLQSAADAQQAKAQGYL